MTVNRRTLLIGLGAAAGAGGTLAGTGAFTQITAERDATVQVAGDAGSLLSITPGGGPNGNRYVSTDAQTGEIIIDLSTEDADGVAPNAVTRANDVLTVTNQGTQAVDFHVTDSTPEGVSQDLVTFEANGGSIEGSANAVELGTGNVLDVDIVVDTTGTNFGNGDGSGPDTILDSVTFVANVASSGSGST